MNEGAAIMKATALVLREELGKLRAQIAAHEARIVEIEDAGTKTFADSFRGAWQSAQPYKRGEWLVHDGAPWVAMEDSTGTRPGDGQTWKMFGKSHR